MIEETITRLLTQSGLGRVNPPITPVSGGFMHRMYKVQVGEKAYAVKHLNPCVMEKDTALDNFNRADALEDILEKAGIPIVPALMLNGEKRQLIDGQYFYVFHWQEGKITDWNHITPEQCHAVGNILGRIHSLDCTKTKAEKPDESAIDWESYVKDAYKANRELGDILSEKLSLLCYADEERRKARKFLPDLCCISDEDMDPKNVMWNHNKPVVIDLECLDYGNPISHVLELSLQWSGITTCDLKLSLTKAFFDGYLEAYDNGFRDYGAVFGLAYNWVEWLVYNVQRALGACMDESERAMGISEVKNTVHRIQYIFSKEQEIKELLNRLK